MDASGMYIYLSQIRLKMRFFDIFVANVGLRRLLGTCFFLITGIKHVAENYKKKRKKKNVELIYVCSAWNHE